MSERTTVVQHPVEHIAVREPHRVLVVQDWGAGVPPLFDQYDATRLAFKEAAESGLLDRPVDVEVLEFEGLPYGQSTTFSRRIEEAIRDFDPIALIGPHTSENLPALLPDIERWQIPTIAMAGTMNAGSPWIFLTPNGTFSDEGILMVDHAIEVFGSRRLGLVREDNLLGDEYAQWIRRRARQRGLAIVADVALGSFTTHDQADAAFTALEAAGADCIAYSGFGGTAHAVLPASQRARARGFRPDLITMSIFMGTIPELHSIKERGYAVPLEDYEGWTGVDQFDEANPFFVDLMDRFAKQFDGRRPMHCYLAQGYDMGNALAHGLAIAKPLSHEGLRLALERVRRVPATAGGPGTVISFGPYDHRGYKGDYIVMRTIQDGRNIAAPRILLQP